MGAPHTVYWLKSFVFASKLTEKKKKEWKAAQKHAKHAFFPRSRPAFGCRPAFKGNT